jgi:hypothetical protein
LADEEHILRKLPDCALRAGLATVRKASFLAGSAEEIVASDGWLVAAAGVAEDGLGLGYGRCALWIDDAHVAGNHDHFEESRFAVDQFPWRKWTGNADSSLHGTSPQALLVC